MNLGKILINEEKDILRVRQALKAVTRIMGFDYMDSIRIATAASELTRNIYEHAQKGEIRLETVEKLHRSGLKLIFTDKGNGIENIEHVLSSEYRSKSGMGIGLSGAKKLMDDFQIRSAPGKGTTVTVTKWLGTRAALSADHLEQMRIDIGGLTEESALESLKSQNRELIEVLDELKTRNSQIGEVNKELEMTNAGILSLYQEIDQKNEELSLASQRKTEFLRSMGHEIRTPVNSILALADVLIKKIDGNLTPEQEKQVRMIAESSRHLLNIIGDLLDLSRIEAGVVDVKISSFLIEELFRRASSTIMPLAAEKGLTLVFKKADDLPEIRTDFKLALQVITNIMGNAVKFTDRGGLLVTAKISQKSTDEEYQITISVQDSGIGIPEDKHEFIFREFKQAHSRDDIKKGTGLGLPISKKILEVLGGSITVKSTPDKGSTFSFTLPVEYRETRERPMPSAANTAPGKKETIILVEDNEKMIFSLREHLEAVGYSVLAARTPEKALKLASTSSPFAICLDIKLPDERDGWDLLKAFKRDPKTKHIPVLVISALKEEEKAIALDADEYMTKPVDMDKLKTTLRRYKKTLKVKTLLVVDDEEAQLTALTAYLKNDYEVLTAGDGRSALDILHTQVPDLIVLDLIMPVMDGFEFLENIKKDSKYASIPVIVYSSKSLTPDEGKALGKKVTDIINKDTMGTEDVARRVRKVFGMLR